MNKKTTQIPLFFLFMALAPCKAQVLWSQQDLNQAGFVTASVQREFMKSDPMAASYAPISIQQYSNTQLQLQEEINKNVSEAVAVYTPVSDPSEWTAIDYEDITPYTWQWVDLQQVHANGDTTQMSLRRPIWWLKEIGAHHSGDIVRLNLPEMGIQGPAVVTTIRPNQLDTRIWHANAVNGYSARPITGKFIHHSNHVYDLYFGDHHTPVGVTGNHRFWSVDRRDWIEAAMLNVGEKVKATDGVRLLKRRVKREITTVVYNLEVYRTHNYLVSDQSLLVHNACWDDLRKKMNRMIREMEDIGVTSVEPDEIMNFVAMDLDKEGAFKAMFPTKVLSRSHVADEIPYIIEKAIYWRWKQGQKISTVSIRVDVSELDPSEHKLIVEGLADRLYNVSLVTEGKKKYLQTDFNLQDGRRFNFYPANDNGD